MPRPSADVVVPFAGDDAAFAAARARLARLAVRDGDSVTLVDNRPGARATGADARGGARRRGTREAPGGDAARDGVEVVAAPEVGSSYFARNRGAAVGAAEWIVFLDADVDFDADLLDRLLDPAPAEDVGVIAGGIEDVVVTDSPIARSAVRRAHMDQRTVTERAAPYAQTAHAAVRRAAFADAGGFAPGIRSGGDADLCFRLAARGWRLAARHDVVVRHAARATLPALVRQLARHGAGAAWVDRRHPGTLPPRSRTQLARWSASAVRAAAGALAGGDRDAALDTALAPLLAIAFEVGRALPNTDTVRSWGRSISTV